MGSFRPDPNLLKKYPNAITLPQLQQKDRFLGALLGLAAGEPSGSVELLLAVLRSLQARRKLELPDVAQAFVRWFGAAPRRVPDLMRAALENLRAGEGHEQSGALAWEDAGRDSPQNGSLVWVGAPLGLSHSKDMEGLADEAAALCRMTHYDPRSVAGSVAVATAITLLVRGEKDADEAIPRAASAAAAFSDDALVVIERGAAKKPDQIDVSARGSVFPTLEVAFSALANFPSFEEGVAAVVARGGDADLNAAVAGALLGAKLGKNQVPEKWLKATKSAAEVLSVGEQLEKQM
jgi:ADP-ribosyl-[dinitrogen reductase] hydrolase